MIDGGSFIYGAMIASFCAVVIWLFLQFRTQQQEMREMDEKHRWAMERISIRYEVRDFLKNELQAHVDEFHKKKEYERL